MTSTPTNVVMQLHCHTLRTSDKTLKFIKHAYRLLNCYSREHLIVQTQWKDSHSTSIVEEKFCHEEYLSLKLLFS